MAPWGSAKRQKERLEEIDARIESERAQVAAREPRVNALVEWLDARRISNGFGEDFEWTLANLRGNGG
jgi:hypothetical protein